VSLIVVVIDVVPVGDILREKELLLSVLVKAVLSQGTNFIRAESPKVI
jgi:hypothetical protein